MKRELKTAQQSKVSNVASSPRNSSLRNFFKKRSQKEELPERKIERASRKVSITVGKASLQVRNVTELAQLLRTERMVLSGFREFCAKEFAAENIEFWLAAEQFRLLARRDELPVPDIASECRLCSCC